MTTNHDCGRRLVLLAVGALGVSCVITQLALLRELLTAFSGNEMVLGIILGNWFLLAGLGSWLGRRADRLRFPMRALVLAQVLIAILPLAQVFLLRALRNVVFIRGAAVGLDETVISTFVLLLPYCLVSGFYLTMACSILAPQAGPAGIGQVYVADGIGSIAGGLLFSFVLIHFFDHFNLLCFPALLNLLLAGLVAFHLQSRILSGLAITMAATVLGLILLVDVDAISTALQYPRQRVVFRGNSPYGKLVVTESAGQFNFIENGLPMISTHNLEQVEETVHYAMAQRPDAARVLLVSGGISGTALEILRYGIIEVTYVELDPLMIEVGRRFLADRLADARIKVINTDGRLFIKRTDRQYDVVILDVPDPSTSQINRFYTAEFFAEVKQVLAKDGVLSFSLGHYENYVSPQLARMLASAYRAVQKSFRNMLMLPGGRVFFLASDGALHDDIAARLAQRGLATQLVNRHYLDAMFTPDRMADLRRATLVTAAVNEDFSPVLYHYQLRHWISQFNVRFSLLEGVALALLAIYLFRLRAVPLAIFASGFAASALEVVLLLAFQVLYGSLYQQVGLIVTMFMAGLAMGAFGMNRMLGHSWRETTAATASLEGKPRLARSRAFSHHFLDLSKLAFLLAGLALLLPLILPLLGRLSGAAASSVAVQAAIPVLTLILAVLVGMEFPLASHVEYNGAAATVSRLYLADFVGACLGALLASTLLIPLFGVTAVCLVTAALNILGGVAVRLRKAAL